MTRKFRKIVSLTAVFSMTCALTLLYMPDSVQALPVASTTEQPVSEGTCGENLRWSVSGDTLTISGTGKMQERLCNAYDYAQAQGIKNIILEEGITDIGFRAFSNMRDLVSVSFPSTLRSIGFAAFDGCVSLKEVYIKSGWIGESAFINCTSLEKVTIGRNVTDMGISAFENCTALNSVFIEDLYAWCQIRFGGIHANPLEYAEHLYLNQEEVKDLVIPEGITKIPDFAFIHGRLNSVVIPAGVTEIGEYAFSLCTGITSVTLPDGLEKIHARAFEGNISLTEIQIPASVSYIGYRAFCAAAVSLVNVTRGKICDYAFEGCGLMEASGIGEEVSHIGAYAYHGCAALGNAVYFGSQEQWNQMEIGIENNPFSEQVQYVGTGTESVQPRTTERITMGTYEGEPLRWRVLQTEDNRKLVITEKAISFMRVYPPEINNNQWSGSTLRQWLNSDFYESVFTEDEKRQIQRTIVSTPDNEIYQTSGGVPVKDDLFLLSAEEVETYFPDEESRMASASAIAMDGQTDSGITNSETCYWWLRSTGMFDYSCMFVDYNGHIREDGAAAGNFIFAVRPAMWIDTTASEKLSLGNINADDAVNASDASWILSACAHRGAGEDSGLSGVQEESADVNADETFDAIDASLILQYSALASAGDETGSFSDFLNHKIYQ